MNRRAQASRTRPAAAAPAAERTPARSRPSLKSWLDQHLYSFFSSAGRIAAKPWATALTVLVMGLALALPLLFLVLLQNARALSGGWQDARDISVFLKPGVAAAAADALAGRLRARADVAAVMRRSPEQGLEEFRALSGFAEALDVLEENPLPQVLVVTPRDASAEGDPAVLADLRAAPEADLVQYDAAWRRRLAAILGLAERAVQVLAGLLALAALLVIGNTVRLDIQTRRDEIDVMQLLGASPGFVRRPFLYSGCWYGLLSGLIALGVCLGVEAGLSGPVTRLLASYDHKFALSGLSAAAAALIPLASAALGWLGAMLATSRHLAEGSRV